jgi:FlaA1/EpsC-like NDP-sugar epimerase
MPSARSYTSRILALPRIAKRLIAISIDAGLCVLSIWLAFYLRLDEFTFPTGQKIWALIATFISIPIFIRSGLYRAIFRYTDFPAMMTVASAVGIYTLVYAFIFTVVGVDNIPRTIGLIQPVILLLLIGASRIFARMWLSGDYQRKNSKSALPRVLIYGAGNAGRQLAGALANSHDMKVVGFLDDDTQLCGRVLNGLSIYSPHHLEILAISLNVSDVLLALPSTSRRRKKEIIQDILKCKIRVRTLPGMSELALGVVTVSDLRELDINDLLEREPVSPDQKLLSKTVEGKVVLVTGAGGSIGSELCRQIVSIKPKIILLIEQNEFSLYEIHQELVEKVSVSQIKVIPLLASVRDKTRLSEIFTTWKPDTVYHAAAYKHVPLVEHNPIEGIRNNVFGTLNIAEISAISGVSNFVLISTDKAVRPTNIMGASKRLAEMILQAFSANDSPYKSTTIFSMVRFGNVLGSSGSVVPKFLRQIQAGGPITLTHTEVTRYFMTIPEASQLVIQAGGMATGGDVFVLEMGAPVRIIDLAKRLVELSGLSLIDESNPNGDIGIEVTGLRPGEKLYEELLIGNSPKPTLHTKIMKADEDFIPWNKLNNELIKLAQALDTNDMKTVRGILTVLVAGYTTEYEIVDWVYVEKMNVATTEVVPQIRTAV